MRSRGFITIKAMCHSRQHGLAIMFFGWLFFSAAAAHAQRISILTPTASPRDLVYAGRIAESIPAPARVMDGSLSDAAFRSTAIANPFNMTTAEANRAAAVIGCDFLVLLHTGGLRRSSFSKPDYFEAFAAHYVVDARTGELRAWVLKSFEAATQDAADRALAASAGETARELKSRMIIENRDAPVFEAVPDPDSAAAADFKAPIPYRRIKPEYTSIAFLYDVRATIDLEADIDAEGKIRATRIVRWAGFGLEESAENAVRSMNWRPATRKGKPLPMRVLLRYNFTKVGKE